MESVTQEKKKLRSVVRGILNICYNGEGGLTIHIDLFRGESTHGLYFHSRRKPTLNYSLQGAMSARRFPDLCSLSMMYPLLFLGSSSRDAAD